MIGLVSISANGNKNLKTGILALNTKSRDVNDILPPTPVPSRMPSIEQRIVLHISEMTNERNTRPINYISIDPSLMQS